MGSYLTWKALHVIGAILMVGNVTVTGFWAHFYWEKRRDLAFRPAARAILWADLLFTLTGGSLLTICGILMLRQSGATLSGPGAAWLRQGIGALALSTLVWLVALLPDQFRMVAADPADDARLRVLFRRWSVLGWASTLLLFYGAWVMVTKRVLLG